MHRTLATTTVAALFVLACARPAPIAEPGATRPAAPSEFLGRLAQSRDLDGKQVGSIVDPAREATVVVVFASWCGPCRHELALMGQLRAERPATVILGLNAYEDWGELSDQARLRQFLGENAPWLRVVHAEDAWLDLLGGVPKIPSLFVFDRQGALVAAFKRNERPPPSLVEVEAAIGQAAGATARVSGGVPARATR